jgi:hypothetical protein
VIVVENAATCPLDAQPMPLDQGRKRGLFAVADEPFQENRVTYTFEHHPGKSP